MNFLSIIIPVYNEQKYLEQSVINLIKIFKQNFEIIIVDDKSSDNSLKIAKKLLNLYPKIIKVIAKKKNEGKGSAIKKGVKFVKGNWVTIHDADLEYNPVYLKIMHEISKAKGEKYAIYGSRFLKNNQWLSLKQKIGNKIITLATNLLYSTKISDMETCYKLFSTKSINLNKIKSNGFEIEAEITSKLIKNKIKIIEIPIKYQARNKHNGKKIKYRDGFRALTTLLKYKFY